MRLHIPPALYHRQYRLLWFGLMISIAGTQMQIWALFWHIRELTDQPIALGGIGLARILPIVLFSLIGGAMADVVNRRKLLFVTQSIMALSAFALAVLTFRNQITLGYIYLLTAINASAVAFDTPARQSLVPNLVPGRDLPSAFSLNSIAMQVGSIAGPALSGLVIVKLGQGYTYLFNAISFLAVILALVFMGPVKQAIRAGTSNKLRSAVSLKAIKEGIHFILNSPLILSTMILDFFATFFSSANTLMPIFARDVLHVGAVEYGWLSAAQSIGAVGAALALSQVQDIRRQGPLFLGSVVVFGLTTIAFGLSTAFWLAMLSLIFVGAADSVSTIIRNTIRQLQTPDYIRGRMTSINQIFFMGGPQLGEVEAGVVAQFFGAPFAIVSGGVGCILAVAWIARRWPQLRTYNGDEPIKAGAAAD
jgi:MFS family permease